MTFIDKDGNPVVHDDGSEVTAQDIQASLLREEMVEFMKAMRQVAEFSICIRKSAEERLASRVVSIMNTLKVDGYDWPEWVNMELYPEE